jgi:hypothetical protein
MDKIELIKDAIERADKMQSGMPISQFGVPALASLKIRHLLNNLGKISTNYLECGVHKGGCFTATISGNPNIGFATAIDSFASDHMDGETAQPQFLQNVDAHHPLGTIFKLIQSDCFSVDTNRIPYGVDMYLYDAGHSYDDQRKALTYYKSRMANEFIYCCDDWTYEDVKAGTLFGIKEGGYEIFFERELLNTTPGDGHLNDEWWRGYYVALLKKKA